MRTCDVLHNMNLVVTDKNSPFYGCTGIAESQVSDKPDHIVFCSLDKNNFGREVLSKEQFAVTGYSVAWIDRLIRELTEKKEALKEFKIIDL